MPSPQQVGFLLHVTAVCQSVLFMKLFSWHISTTLAGQRAREMDMFNKKGQTKARSGQISPWFPSGFSSFIVESNDKHLGLG